MFAVSYNCFLRIEGVFHISVSWWFFLLEFEWQQVSSSLQDSSQYYGRSQYCCSLDNLHLSCYFQVLQSLYQSFNDCTNYNWYNRHFHIPELFFNSLASSRYLSLFLHSFTFTLYATVTVKSSVQHVLSFLLIIIRSGRLAEIRWSVFISKSRRSLCV